MKPPPLPCINTPFSTFRPLLKHLLGDPLWKNFKSFIHFYDYPFTKCIVLNDIDSRMLVFLTMNHIVSHMLVFSTRNHIASHVLVFLTEVVSYRSLRLI